MYVQNVKILVQKIHQYFSLTNKVTAKILIFIHWYRNFTFVKRSYIKYCFIKHSEIRLRMICYYYRPKPQHPDVFYLP